MGLQISDDSISLRKAIFSDEEMQQLRMIYASTREEELSRVPWPDDLKESFLTQQFSAQHEYYQEIYPDADYWFIIQNGDTVVGRLYMNSTAASQVRIVDISLLPDYRSRGCGTRLLKDVQRYCSEINKSLSIHVERFNPALNLYKRLGFRQIDDSNEVYLLMEWKAGDLSIAS